MALQKVFKKDYIEYLRTHIELKNYLSDEFPYDDTQTVKLFGIEHPEGLIDKLVPTPDGDLQTAIAIYEAYPNLTPLVAQQDALWIYLTHVDLFSYVKQRWPIKFDDGVTPESLNNYILNHWHHNLTNFLRTTFAGLWWNVYLTRDEERDDPYELTRVMFDAGPDWRIMRFGELSLIRNKESMIGVLEFLRDNPEITSEHFIARGQFISRYFNILGGVQQLASQNRLYYREKLDAIKERIISIKSIDDIHHKDITI